MLSWSGSRRRIGKERAAENHNCIEAHVCQWGLTPRQDAGNGKGLAHIPEELALSQRLDPASGRDATESPC